MTGQTENVTTLTKIVQRQDDKARVIECDICIVGAGISGVAAALQAAELGKRVILVDGLPALGGQAVNSIIGTFCGLFSNGTHGYQFTYGVADRILKDLEKQDNALFYRHGPLTTVVYYDEVALGRWVEQAVLDAGIQTILGGMIQNVRTENRRISEVTFTTRYGNVTVRAPGFVDASGDAALAWEAGLACREPTEPVFGTQMVVLENIDEARMPTRDALGERMAAVGDDYGLRRKECIPFIIPGRGIAALNMTHVATPLDPLEASLESLKGKDQAERAVHFLRSEFPEAFANSRVRAFGFPGIRQTRWIVGAHQLSLEEVRNGVKFDDAIGRTAWPVELHDHDSGHVWQTFDEDHVHYIPLGSMICRDADNVIAVGRCIDADTAALSSVRVMGPCMAMGMAAAHALDLAGSGSVHQIDLASLRQRVAENVERV